TDDQGRARITIPRNVGGFGYVCYSHAGIGGNFPVRGHGVTQDYEGARDLDIRPADPGDFVQVCRVWAATGTPIRGTLHFDDTGWTEATRIELELANPAGARIGSRSFARAAGQGQRLEAAAPQTGWHTFRIRSANTPATNSRPAYKLTVSYHAPQQDLRGD